jgi:hypothetical protein
MLQIRVGALLLILLITGCSSLPHNHLEKNARIHIKETDIVLAVAQEEIIGEIESSNAAAATGGGLLGALIGVMIDNSRAKKAEKAVTPVRDKLIDYDYANILANELDEKIKQVDWLKANNLQLERSINNTWVNDKVNATSASAILLMQAKYYFTPDLSALQTEVALMMFPNTAALNEYKEKADVKADVIESNDNIYRNNIISSTTLFEGKSKKENQLELEKGDGTNIKEALHKNAKEIAIKIYEDLNMDGEK